MAAVAGEPEVIRDKAAMRAWARRRRAEGKAVALVPTMGFLHDGHLSLGSVAAAAASASGPVAVVVSIYVNPSQFAPTEDLATYPSDLAGDLRKLAATGAVAAVFCPPYLYVRAGAGGSGHETWIRVERLEKGLCGSSRPVFFRGVATVVAKLFNIVEPDIAVFGKKDYQQWRVICRMVRDLDFAIDIIGSEIVREADGLAMSSRNVHLSHEEREKDNNLKALHRTRSAGENGSRCCKCRYDEFSVNFVEEAIHYADPSLGTAYLFPRSYFHITERKMNGSFICSIVRNKQFETALSIHRSLVNAKTAALNGNNHSQQIKDQIVQTLAEAGGQVDYVEIVEQESSVALERMDRPAAICVAAWFGKVRLIDNIEIQTHHPDGGASI